MKRSLSMFSLDGAGVDMNVTTKLARYSSDLELDTRVGNKIHFQGHTKIKLKLIHLTWNSFYSLIYANPFNNNK